MVHIGDFHPLVLHYPIVLVSAVVTFDGVSCFTKRNFEDLTLWTLIVAVAFFIPTVITGLYAAKFYSQINPTLMTHRTMAFVTSGFSVIHLFFRFYLRKKGVTGRAKWLFLLSAINFALVAVTADFGGVLVFGKSPFFLRK